MSQAAAQLSPPGPEQPPAPVPRPLGFLVRGFCRMIYADVRIDALSVQRIRSLAARGSLVYVMRQRSWVDYLLVAYVLFKEGLPTPEFANDLWGVWFRPLPDLMRAIWKRLLERVPFRRKLREFEERDRCQRMVAAGRPVLVFMRGRVPRMGFLGGRRQALMGTRTGSEYLREIVHHMWNSETEVSLVPIAVFRGRGMRRKDARMRTSVYPVQEMPSELRRLVTHLWNPRETNIRVGGEVRLREFTGKYQHEGEERLVRRLGRALLIYLYREERLVWGPPLLAKRRVRQRVLQDKELSDLVSRLSIENQQAEAQVWRQAGRSFDEIAADFNGLYFSILEFAFRRVWPRVFQGMEYSGLERVVECVKQHPVVLLPTHRSHFDYLILSYIFHINYLSPPHIAAGINLSFWPLGPLFRGAGAYFIRRSFADDELYKMVFRKYLTFLISEGYTQEFFIEGGRSRTGKILTPRLGMLSAVVEAFLGGVRRDLYLVPVSIQYGRVVEEDAYQHELGGEKKQAESLSGLLKARRVLRRRHGTAYVRFATPISLNDVLGTDKERLQQVSEPSTVAETRRFTRKLGFRLLREMNKVTVAGATSVSSTVLLSLSQGACRYDEFVLRALALTRFLRFQGAEFSTSLERNAAGGFNESLSFLGNGGLIRTLPCEGETVIYVPPEKRVALDFYKNNTIHFFLVVALLMDGLARSVRAPEINSDVAWWLDLFRWEFPLPEQNRVVEELDRLTGYLRQEQVLVGAEGEETIVADHPFVRTVLGILDDLRESYWAAARVLMSLPEEGMAHGTMLEQMHARYEAGILLGELSKPEGNSSVTHGNALNRFEELGCVTVVSGKGKKDKIVERGANFGKLAPIAERIRVSLGIVGRE